MTRKHLLGNFSLVHGLILLLCATLIIQVKATSTPPQASFTYSPSAPYFNGTTYFDASASYSYNGTITNYSWNWGDGSPKNSTSSPTITHVFKSTGTFLVTLNVTDSQDLWCTSQKPVKVLPTTPPIANFTFSPNPTWINASTRFDASLSSPGWNGTGYPPIINYTWTFGDGTAQVNTSNPITYHQFTKLGNFTTMLTVKDTRGMTGTKSQNVRVISVTQHPDIAITNVSFAPPPALYPIAPNYYQPYKGWSGYVLVTVLNNGTTTVSDNVTLSYSNGSSHSLGTQALHNLPSQGSVVLQYWWNTSLLEPTMNYTITATAAVLLGESNTQNNQYSVIARLKGAGDLNGDGVVNLKDLGLVTGNWQLKVPPANPLADPNGDGGVNLKDLGLVTGNWQKKYS